MAASFPGLELVDLINNKHLTEKKIPYKYGGKSNLFVSCIQPSLCLQISILYSVTFLCERAKTQLK